MDITEIIKEPFFSSKRRNFLLQNKFVLSFLVAKKANKIMIKKAMQTIFGVSPLQINVLNRKPKPARKTLKSRENFTKAQKIAHISLTQTDFMNLKRAIEGEGMPEDNIPKEVSDTKELESQIEVEADSLKESEVKEIDANEEKRAESNEGMEIDGAKEKTETEEIKTQEQFKSKEEEVKTELSERDDEGIDLSQKVRDSGS